MKKLILGLIVACASSNAFANCQVELFKKNMSYLKQIPLNTGDVYVISFFEGSKCTGMAFKCLGDGTIASQHHLPTGVGNSYQAIDQVGYENQVRLCSN